MKEKIYAFGILAFAILLLGTQGAVFTDNLTFGEGVWQTIISSVAILWLWNLIKLEETRAARRRR